MRVVAAAPSLRWRSLGVPLFSGAGHLFLIQKCVKDHRCNKLSTGVVASVGTIGMLIPPSIVLII